MAVILFLTHYLPSEKAFHLDLPIQYKQIKTRK